MNSRILYLISKRGTFDGTGIDRVTRALHNGLVDVEPTCAVWPVYLDDEGHMFRSARLSFDGKGVDEGERVVVGAGDLIFSADLVYDLSERAKAQLVYWKRQGVPLYFVLYDLIPIRRPEWFSGESVHVERVTYLPTFEKWVHFVFAEATGLLCISKVVEDDARIYAVRDFKGSSPNLQFGYFHLGFDIEASRGSGGLDKITNEKIGKITARPAFLMVGTLEPRKSHRLALDAFELLWQEGRSMNLVVAGRAGKPWMSNYASELVAKFDGHQELGDRLFWLDGVSDKYLRALYDRSTALMMLSESEGFGLPLVEAANAGLPIIARDIPIFHELCAGNAYYFDGKSAGDLAETLREWLVLLDSQSQPASVHMKVHTWKEAARNALQIMRGMHGERHGQ